MSPNVALELLGAKTVPEGSQRTILRIVVSAVVFDLMSVPLALLSFQEIVHFANNS